MNVKVGITQYVSDGKGFYAYWKYSDFQVTDVKIKRETLVALFI